jgi:hypothetical protein
MISKITTSRTKMAFTNMNNLAEVNGKKELAIVATLEIEEQARVNVVDQEAVIGNKDRKLEGQTRLITRTPMMKTSTRTPVG